MVLHVVVALIVAIWVSVDVESFIVHVLRTIDCSSPSFARPRTNARVALAATADGAAEARLIAWLCIGFLIGAALMQCWCISTLLAYYRFVLDKGRAVDAATGILFDCEVCQSLAARHPADDASPHFAAATRRPAGIERHHHRAYGPHTATSARLSAGRQYSGSA